LVSLPNTHTPFKLSHIYLYNCYNLNPSVHFTIVHIFGPAVGPLMHEHANQEQSFKQNNVGPDGKMTSLDDEFLPEEAKKTAIKIRKTTANLVRHFQVNPQLQLKLKQSMGDQRLSEYSQLIESFEQMKSLWWTKLTRPLEEENSIQEQLRILDSRTKKLREIRD
jgi:hypothetical protein